jgi:predicted transcriptional regulator
VAQYKDLKRVGQWLRARRTEQHIARTDLARSVGVSPTYLWMVEEARERANGEASQPGQPLLRQLATELGMTDQESHDLLRLAGYFPIEDGPVNSATPVFSSTPNLGSVDPKGERTMSQQRVLGLLDAMREEILGTVFTDETLLPRFRADLIVFLPETQVSAALQLMDEQRYSQVVVQDRGRLRLLSSEGIVRWLLDGGSHDAFTDARIGDLLASEPPDSMVTFSGSNTIGEAMAALVDQPSLVAILLTATGNETEPPLGIITTWDLVDVVRAWTDES